MPKEKTDTHASILAKMWRNRSLNNYEVMDIEREILGAILLKNELVGIALSHDINENMFNNEKHKSIYKMMRLLSGKGNSITVALMAENYPNEFKK